MGNAFDLKSLTASSQIKCMRLKGFKATRLQKKYCKITSVSFNICTWWRFQHFQFSGIITPGKGVDCWTEFEFYIKSCHLLCTKSQSLTQCMSRWFCQKTYALGNVRFLVGDSVSMSQKWFFLEEAMNVWWKSRYGIRKRPNFWSLRRFYATENRGWKPRDNSNPSNRLI